MWYSYEYVEHGALIIQLDVEVDGELNMGSGGPEMDVKGLYPYMGVEKKSGKNMLKSEVPITILIAKVIKEAIENDHEWQCEQAEEDGWNYQSLGGTDPDAHWAAPKYGGHYED